MVTITYEALNNLVHEFADDISNTTGIPKDMMNLFRLNDLVTAYLSSELGVQYEDEIDEQEANEALRDLSFPKEV